MRCSWLIPITGLVVASCSDRATPPVAPPPGYDFTNGPAVIDNAEIFRWTWTGAQRWGFGDNDGTLWVYHYDALNAHPLCDPGVEGVTWTEQHNYDALRAAERYLGFLRDGPVVIYPYIAPADRWWMPIRDAEGNVIPERAAALCDWLSSAWLYRGTHSLVWRDNDVTGGDDTPGLNSYGFTANGTVSDRHGRQYRYHEMLHEVYDWSPECPLCYRQRRHVITVR